jgi:hypothetical protein
VLTTASALGVVPEPVREDAGQPAAARP